MWAASHFADHYPVSYYSEFGIALSNRPIWDALSMDPHPPTLCRPLFDSPISYNLFVINSLLFCPVDESVTVNRRFFPFLAQKELFLAKKASFFTEYEPLYRPLWLSKIQFPGISCLLSKKFIMT